MKRKFLACLALIGFGFGIFTAAESDEKTVLELKQNLRKYIAQKAGKTPSGTTIPKGDPANWAWEQYHAVQKQDQKVLYWLVGEHLLIADKRYLPAKKAEEKRHGLGIAYEACTCALHRIKDPKLGVAICEAYVIPNLEFAEESHYELLSKVNLIELIIDAYANAEDAPKLIAAFRLLLENAHNRNTQDGARLRLAQVLDKQQRYEEAIDLLKEIDDKGGVRGAKKLIPIIEKKMKK